jgi:hypothetical protein
MDQAAISWALSQGAPVTCATCRHFHEGNMHCAQPECGGPGVGRDFPIYDGPIPRSKFIERCLVCGGDRIEFHIVMGEDKTKFALCKKHRNTYSHVGAPEGKLRHPVKLIAIP